MLDGAMVLWSPGSSDESDSVATLINLLERFSEGSSDLSARLIRASRK